MSGERARPQAPIYARGTCLAVLVLLYVPLMCVVIPAFRTPENQFSLAWFQLVIGDHILLEALWNSLYVAILSSLSATILGVGAAVAIYRGNFLGKGVLEILSYVSLVVPEIVFALALLAWFFALGLSLSLTTVIIAHITFSISYVILTLGSRLDSFDWTLEDAARDLGASDWEIFLKITLPLLGPALFASILLCFLLSFDDFLITFFVNGAGSDTLPVKLYGLMKIGTTPKVNALATIMWGFTAVGLLLGGRFLPVAVSKRPRRAATAGVSDRRSVFSDRRRRGS